ncbi:polysaccharide deacetylase [Romboutsia ilealis]|uniref:Polysaccharide deacetylase n=1 Tax=Romboutsia faecis TaxID=2764597 RepID=A0ABR7JQI9_9FIRM|nr:polysaccharide deacetylase family protein [Romboutsia faecis]MBC5997182.1 polysaccharide deacetylase [Romboutsia faecis]MRN23464.1 polysaccharide deacetylase [Romboutsia ilealis]
MSYKNRKVNKSKVILVAVIGLIIVGVANKTWAYVDEQRHIKAEQQRIEEEKRKAEEEKKKYMVGVSHEGKKYSYDAKLVYDKLSKYDYSNDGKKIVFLTFDDGTSTTVTPQILKTLKDEDVKATFFLTGENIERGGEKAKELIKQEFNEGHAIANHSYSHDYKLLYPNRNLDLEAFKADFAKTDKIIKDVLGKYFSTRVLRCPGGHMSWRGMDELDTYLEENNKVSIDWNALNADAEGKRKNAQELADYAIKTAQGKEMVVLLMHDTYGKEETAKALPTIIKYFKDNGYEFKTLV